MRFEEEQVQVWARISNKSWTVFAKRHQRHFSLLCQLLRCCLLVCCCSVTVAVFQVVMSVFRYFYILESEACSSFHIRRSAIGVWETSVLYPQGPVLRMWVTKLALNVNSLKWARISFFPLSSPPLQPRFIKLKSWKETPSFFEVSWIQVNLKWLLGKVAPFKVKNTLQQNETTAVKYGL